MDRIKRTARTAGAGPDIATGHGMVDPVAALTATLPYRCRHSWRPGRDRGTARAPTRQMIGPATSRSPRPAVVRWRCCSPLPCTPGCAGGARPVGAGNDAGARKTRTPRDMCSTAGGSEVHRVGAIECLHEVLLLTAVPVADTHIVGRGVHQRVDLLMRALQATAP